MSTHVSSLLRVTADLFLSLRFQPCGLGLKVLEFLTSRQCPNRFLSPLHQVICKVLDSPPTLLWELGMAVQVGLVLQLRVPRGGGHGVAGLLDRCHGLLRIVSLTTKGFCGGRDLVLILVPNTINTQLDYIHGLLGGSLLNVHLEEGRPIWLMLCAAVTEN